MRYPALVFAAVAAIAAAELPIVGLMDGDPVARLGINRRELRRGNSSGRVRYVRKTEYLDARRAVVTHTMDDSNDQVPKAIDAMDKYGIKATLYVNTNPSAVTKLWPRLNQAIRDGHELGAHSRNHRCAWPDTPEFCATAYGDSEVAGARDDILKNTSQEYVWTWAYPCGLCAGYDTVQQKLAAAGYIMARTYPDEQRGGHIVPDLQTYAGNWYAAAYTQTCQTAGGIAASGRTDVAELNAKFDEVYRRGGIYSFMSHAQWLEFGPDGFYERHLAHIGGREDVWYVPSGLLYAYKRVSDRTRVIPLDPVRSMGRFVVVNDLDGRVYRNSITLEFAAAAPVSVKVNGRPLPERPAGLTDRYNGEYFRREGTAVYVTVRPGVVVEFQ